MKINSLPIDSVEIDSLTNGELIEETLSTIRIERSQTTQVIRLFEEISRRKLYLDYAYPSLYEMAVNHFGYCAGSAMRRINAMKMIRDIPDVAEKLESGALSLSVVSEVQSFFYQEARNERPYSIGAKIELIEKSVGMSRREVERELANRNPEREKRETSYAVSNDRFRISITISRELNEKLNRLKDLLGHVNPDMTTESLLERLAEYGLDKHDPKRKAARTKSRAARRTERPAPAQNREVTAPRSTSDQKSTSMVQSSAMLENSPPPAEVAIEISAVIDDEGQTNADGLTNIHADANARARANADAGAGASDISSSTQARAKDRSRYIPARERDQVHDDGDGCMHQNSKTGRRCGSAKFLQLDHIEPFAKGGVNEAPNLRWMCGAHNRYRANR